MTNNQERGATMHKQPIQLGDIFECSWGYNQTNIDYYQVVALSKTGRVKLQEIRSRSYTNPQSCSYAVGPVPDSFIGAPTGYKVPQTYDAWTGEFDPWVRISSYSGASRIACAGDDVTEIRSMATGIGWGH